MEPGMEAAQRRRFVQRLTERRGIRQFVKFGIVGASGTIVNLVIFTLLQRLTGNPVWVDFSIGFMFGGVSNYFLNRAWTFRSSRHAGREGAQFLTVSFIALLVGNLVVYLLDTKLAFHHAHRVWLVSTASGIFVNFFLNKYWTFREP
jgi:dolichol-phosphate mannosyltransferase